MTTERPEVVALAEAMGEVPSTEKSTYPEWAAATATALAAKGFVVVEQRSDGVLVGGPVGLHVCPACGLPHPLPAQLARGEDAEAQDRYDASLPDDDGLLKPARGGRCPECAAWHAIGHNEANATQFARGEDTP